eukprot:TRINITY_DN19371_c0_g1_i2.p1 TRINITY_DN19371_c0_g1~~TRINITY_DN19371_c0_g1_i2.p1  ORF type:complete len:178 (+),score=33.51 TRINITY_DN19371_c0_g1_i2:99-632(+)
MCIRDSINAEYGATRHLTMPVGNGFREQSTNTSYLLNGDESLCSAHELISDKSEEIMEACGAFDIDRTGKVSAYDLRRILYAEIHVLPSHMDKIMTTVTPDTRGDVFFGEWLSNFSRSTRTRLSSRGGVRVACLLYTSDAADEEDSVDLGGRRIIKKKKRRNIKQDEDIYQKNRLTS